MSIAGLATFDIVYILSSCDQTGPEMGQSGDWAGKVGQEWGEEVKPDNHSEGL